MLRRIQEVVVNSDVESEQIFDDFLALAEEFVSYLKEHEGIDAVALCEHQRDFVIDNFNSLPRDKQKEKFESFKAVYETCQEITAKGGKISDKGKTLARFMWKYRLAIPRCEEVFDLITENTYIEVYDTSFRQRYRSPNFLEITNHCLMALETAEFYNLYVKSEEIQKSQIEQVSAIVEGKIKDVIFEPCEVHTVKEINSKENRSSQSKALAFVPLYCENGKIEGFLHIFDLIDSRSLKFELA